MKRKYRLAAGVTIAILLFLWLIKAPIFATYFSHKVNLPLFFDRISLGLTEMDIHRLKVANPWRFKSRTALRAKTTKLQYDTPNLRTDPVIFDSIELDKVFIEVDFLNPASNQSNWSLIGKRILKGVNYKSKGVQIRQVVLNDVTVIIKGKPDIDGERHIPRIELSNIDSEHGFPTQNLIEQIFQESGLEEFIQAIFYPEEKILEIPFRIFFGPK